MASMPEIRYAKSREAHIAYQVMGSGPLDLVLVPGFVSHLEIQLETHGACDYSSAPRPSAG
jgi:hypothetical protein